MKFIVDKLPEEKYDCYYAEWVPLPPIMERPGDYFCNLTNKRCNLIYDNNECEGLKTYDYTRNTKI